MKYTDPRWQRKRLEILSRDEFSCVVCKATTKELHVHHKRYYGELWQVDNDDLQTLCVDCHSALGPHPKGGVWWSTDPDLPGVGFGWSHCPICGSDDLKDQGSNDKCNDCGHRILPDDYEPINAGWDSRCQPDDRP